MSNPYNAPNHIFNALLRLKIPLIAAIVSLGPSRIQWNPIRMPYLNNKGSDQHEWSTWLLDGHPARVGEIIEAERGARVA